MADLHGVRLLVFRVADLACAVEVAAVRMEGWEETGRFNRLVNPQRPMSAKATEICDHLTATYGARFATPAMLRDMAAKGGSFYAAFGDGRAAA